MKKNTLYFHLLIADWYGLPYMKRLMSNRRWEEMLEVPESEPIRTEGQLVRELLSGYSKRGRPVINVSFLLSFQY